MGVRLLSKREKRILRKNLFRSVSPPQSVFFLSGAQEFHHAFEPLFVRHALDQAEPFSVNGIIVHLDAFVQVVAFMQAVVKPADVFGESLLDGEVADPRVMRHEPVVSEFMRHHIFHAFLRQSVERIDVETLGSLLLLFRDLASEEIARHDLFHLGKIFEQSLFRHDTGLAARLLMERLLVDQEKVNRVIRGKTQVVFELIAHGKKNPARLVFIGYRTLCAFRTDDAPVGQSFSVRGNLAGETARLLQALRTGEEGVVRRKRPGGGTLPADRALRQLRLIAFLRTENFVSRGHITSADPSGADGTARQGAFRIFFRAGTGTEIFVSRLVITLPLPDRPGALIALQSFRRRQEKREKKKPDQKTEASSGKKYGFYLPHLRDSLLQSRRNGVTVLYNEKDRIASAFVPVGAWFFGGLSGMSKTVSGSFEIRNSCGLHARPASLFVQAAVTYESEISVRNETTGDKVDGKSVMGLLMLAAPRGTRLTITASGNDAERALEALGALILKGFDEE